VNKISTVTALLLLIFSSSINAFDEKREGFLLGIGFGVGYDYYTGIQYDSIGEDRKDNSSIAFAASPRIGYGFNETIALLYARHPLSYTVKSDSDKDIGIITCTEGLQFMYYPEELSLPIYFGAGAGIGYYFDEDTSNEPGMNYSSNSLKGPALYGIIGYEPVKHVTTELTFHLRSQQDGAFNAAVSLLVGVIGY
jgi:hypothetical protein